MTDDLTLLTPREVAGILHRSEYTVRQLIHAEQLPSVLIGGRRLVPRCKLAAWLEERTSLPRVPSQPAKRAYQAKHLDR